MKSRTRYTLIAACIISFLIASPFIVMYVTGIKYDFSGHHFVKTGLISVKTQPSGATIALNGKVKGHTPATLHFVIPGDYDILIHHDGYFDWQKRLAVRAQYVTYLNQNLDYIYLFYSNPGKKDLVENVSAFSSGPNRLLYLSGRKIFLADSGTPDKAEQLELPEAISNPHIISSADENYYVIYGDNAGLIFDVRNNRLFDFSKYVKTAGTADINALAQTLQFGDNDRLYAVSGGVVYDLDWNNQKITPIVGNVLGFAVKSGSIYYVEAAAGTTDLVQQNLGGGQKQRLITNLPAWSSAKLFLSAQNQPFIIGDNSLYTASSVGTGFQRLADYIQNIKIYDRFGKVLLESNNELNLYDIYTGKRDNITRSAQEIKNPSALSDLGWAFYINDGRLQNMEIDNRDHQNNYTFANVSNNADFSVSADGTKIFLLDNSKLQQLDIR